MNGASTLEYGYATGRHDPPTRIVPADEPDPRSTSTPQQEGLQAEKVIKGIFTGNFNFAFNINAPANTTALTITGTMNAVNLPGLKLTYTWTSVGSADLLQLNLTTTGAGTSTSYIRVIEGGVTMFRLTGDGSLLLADSVSANFPTISFLNDPDTGIQKAIGVLDRLFGVAGGLGIFEWEKVAGAPGDGIRRCRFYGTGNSISEPQVTHGGGFNNGQSAGVWWSEVVVGNPRVALVNNGAFGISIGQPAISAAAAFRVHVELGSSAFTAAAGQSAAIVRISGQQTRATSGTHPTFNTLQLDSIDDGAANAGLLTDSTTLYIEGAPQTDTQGKVTNFRAIWVRAPVTGGGGASGFSGGGVDFDGDFIVTGALRVGRGGQGNSMVSILFGTTLAGANLVMGKAGAGNHPHLVLLQMQPYTTSGVATHTDATILHIVAAPNTAPTGGKNRAIWVQSGTGGGLVELEGLFRVNNTFTAAAGVSAVLIDFTGTLTEAGAGNHPRLSLVEFAALGVTAGAATVTDATTVYIAGAPGGVVTGKNRALWVVAGESEFGGIVTVALDRGLRFVNQTNQAAAAVGTLNNAPAAGDPAVWVPITVAGVNRAFPAW